MRENLTRKDGLQVPCQEHVDESVKPHQCDDLLRGHLLTGGGRDDAEALPGQPFTLDLKEGDVLAGIAKGNGVGQAL